MSKSKINKYLFDSSYLFYLALFINLTLLSVTKFYPSMDGAAHLYNVNIIKQLIWGNELFAKFYEINSLPIPNWTSHFILSFFHFFLPAWLAEKALLILYVLGMALSFRFLVKTISPQNISLSILIFPFIYSFLFHLGFYNFSISFILYFTSLAYWLNSFQNNSYRHYIYMFLLINIAYFTNVLMFGFLGLTIGFYILYFSYAEYLKHKDFRLTISFALKKMLPLLSISLPGLIFAFVFYRNISFFPTDQIYSTEELVKWINDVRALIVYAYSGEEILTEQFFHIILVLLTLSFVFKNKAKNESLYIKFRKADVIALPLLIAVVLYFVTPNGSSAGMMSDRYCLIIFVLLVTWTVLRAVPGKWNRIIIPIALLLHIGLLLKHLNGNIRGLNKNAETIYDAGAHINENSIVLPINFSDSWLEPHFSNYLGVDKPLIILENYEANVGWFPVIWSRESMPEILLANKKQLKMLQWVSNNKSEEKVQINNVLLYGNQNKINEADWQELKEVLAQHYKLIYKSEDNYVLLYEQQGTGS